MVGKYEKPMAKITECEIGSMEMYSVASVPVVVIAGGIAVTAVGPGGSCGGVQVGAPAC